MSYLRNQRGTVAPAILVLITVVGIVVYLLASSLLSFENPFFGQLFPKKSSRAAGIVDLSLVPSAVTVSKDKTFLLDVVIDAKTERPSAMELGLNYDPQTLQLISFERGQFFAKDLLAPQISTASGTIDADLAQEANTLKSGTGSIAALTFKAIKATTPTTAVTINPERTRIASIGKGSQDVLGAVSNSTVTVTIPTPTPTPTPSASPSPSATPTPTPKPSPTVTPNPLAKNVYRLYYPQIYYHFYTISPAVRDYVIATYGYVADGSTFKGFENAAADPQAAPVYDTYNQYSDHFYTINAQEKDAVIQYYGYKYLGISFYAYTTPGPNRVPVYRLTNNLYDHFYTASVAERDAAIANFGYRLETIAFYAPL